MTPYLLPWTKMSMRDEYFWLKGIIESPKNRSHHRPALRRLIDLYEAKWTGRSGIKPALIAISVNALREGLKQG